MSSESKFLSRKFLITLLCMLIATIQLTGSDLALVLTTCTGAYSIANAGAYIFKGKNARLSDNE